MQIPRIPKASDAVTVGTSDTTIYKVTSGRTFSLKSVILTNPTASDAEVSIYDGASADGRRKLDIMVSAGTTKVLDKNVVEGIEFKYGDVVGVSSVDGVVVTVTGEEQ